MQQKMSSSREQHALDALPADDEVKKVIDKISLFVLMVINSSVCSFVLIASV
jgi:hypothetical protein